MPMKALEIIAYMRSDFPTKFGLPRQSGLIGGLPSRIVMEPRFSRAEAFRGIDGYSHIWVLWGFSDIRQKEGEWSPTVRPPRLGGNERVGVFATRSPYRPNPIGLSSLRLLSVEEDPESRRVSLLVEGSDLMDGTPIYDIKPYLPYTDSHPDAEGGFAAACFGRKLTAKLPDPCRGILPPDKEDALLRVLEEDPRPSYQNDEREYGFFFGDHEVRFTVADGVATVTEIRPKGENEHG